MVSRVERTRFGAWWWPIDGFSVVALGAIMLGGIVLSLAASPPVAARIGLDAFYFVHRHLMFLVPAIAAMLVISFLSPRQLRRLALVVFIVSLALVVATLFVGAEVKGARRWIVLAGLNIQPSEFLKPSFVVLCAWLFAESARKPDMPATTFSLLLLLGVVGVLVLQPDFGQTMLIALVWGALFFIAGMRLIWVAGLGGTAVLGLVAAYASIPHVARRIKRFLDPASGDTFQVDTAVESDKHWGGICRANGAKGNDVFFFLVGRFRDHAGAYGKGVFARFPRGSPASARVATAITLSWDRGRPARSLPSTACGGR